ncbi:MAG: 6-carboxytetrahydropterin synthase QueD [Planctomycetota bacterium]|nr:6-carboxytetrahydropterin synthase QueD [Planctomycetota bacterium]
MEIFKEFRFEAAHDLPDAPEGHQCRRLHGHSYLVRVCVRGKIDPRTGWVCDFGDIKAVVKPLIDQLDHQYLNDIEGLSQSTAERLAQWFWRKLHGRLAGLSKIEVWETPTSGCAYSGEDEPA